MAMPSAGNSLASFYQVRRHIRERRHARSTARYKYPDVCSGIFAYVACTLLLLNAPRLSVSLLLMFSTNLRFPFCRPPAPLSHKHSTSQTMCASAAAGSMRIMLMPVDAWKTIKQVSFSILYFPSTCKQSPQLQCPHVLPYKHEMLIFVGTGSWR